MSNNLPELATLLATHLRQALGDQRIYARVIMPAEAASLDDLTYISVGEVVLGDEIERFVLLPPLQGEWPPETHQWRLEQIVDFPGSRSEPPSTDWLTRLTTPAPDDVFEKIATIWFEERLAGFVQNFLYDRQHLEEVFDYGRHR
jgi:hypothetical protein